MKKQNLLKLAFTMLAMIVMTGAMAQTVVNEIDGVTSYVEYADTDDPSMVTVGMSIPLYVRPDVTYSPNWTSAGGWLLNDNSSWVWGITVSTATGTSIVNDNLNYVEVLAGNTVGTATVSVYEKNSTIPCDGDSKEIDILVVAAPEKGDITITDIATPTAGTITAADASDYVYCENATDLPSSISINLSGYPNFELDWEASWIALDANGNETGSSTSINNAVDVVGAGSSTTRLENEEYSLFTGPFELDGTNPGVKYTFTFRGVTDLISRKGDFLAGSRTWFSDDEVSFTITVWQAPTTGPIFHIPNNFGTL